MIRLMIVEPVVTVLIYSSFAALAAIVGVIPHALGAPASAARIGWGSALAAGLMLGVAYTLLTLGLGEALAQGGLGALTGIAFVRLTHAVTRTGDLDPDLEPDLDLAFGPAAEERTRSHADPRGRKALLRDTIHAAHEGVAIGVAMALALPLGITMAVALAAHNIPEAAILTGILARRNVSTARSAALVVATNLNQILFAAATFVALGAAPALVPWVAGFAVGALLYLVLAELLPQAYRQAGHTAIALVAIAAMGVLVLLTPGAP